MKKPVLLVLMILLAVLPLSANTFLINAGANLHRNIWGEEELTLRSIGLNFTNLASDDTGFYYQINPYFGLCLKEKGSDEVIKLREEDVLVVGSDFLLGYGGDLNFGDLGVLLGGGFATDIQYYGESNDNQITALAGLGLGANLYYQPGNGNFIVDLGFKLAWNPLAGVLYDGEFDFHTDFGMATASINAGIGCVPARRRKVVRPSMSYERDASAAW